MQVARCASQRYLHVNKKEKSTHKLSQSRHTRHQRNGCATAQGYVTFEEFLHWFKALKEKERRGMRRRVKRHIRGHRRRPIPGRLNKAEFARLANKATKTFLGMLPPFELESDWEKCKAATYKDQEKEITYSAFELWWKERLGVDDSFPDIPVLPEFMVQKVDETSRLLHKRMAKQGEFCRCQSSSIPS